MRHNSHFYSVFKETFQAFRTKLSRINFPGSRVEKGEFAQSASAAYKWRKRSHCVSGDLSGIHRLPCCPEGPREFCSEFGVA